MFDILLRAIPSSSSIGLSVVRFSTISIIFARLKHCIVGQQVMGIRRADPSGTENARGLVVVRTVQLNLFTHRHWS